ncbi:MAG: type II secretion system protein GspJ [Bacteriovoracia bacterium]
MSFRSVSRQGFTLLEVLISFVILAFISLAIYQATNNTYDLHAQLLADSDFYSEIRLSFAIMDKDVAAIFSPHLMAPPKPTPTPNPDGSLPPPDPNEGNWFEGANRASDYWGVAIDKTGLRPSRFVGNENSFSFITASHIRIYRESRESFMAKVSYRLEDDDRAEEDGNDPKENYKMLVKTENQNAFDLEKKDEEDKLHKRYQLLHGIKSLKYRYYRKDKTQWVTSWDTDHSDTKNIYPDVIEVEFEVRGGPRLNHTGRFRFRPEMPLNGLSPSV